MADTLLHPVRLRIVQALVGRQLTTQELKDELRDVPQASLYRHVARLVEAGLLRVTDARSVRGGTERTYAVIESAVELGPEAFASATIDDHLRYFATFVGALLTGFERHLRSSAAGALDVPGRAAGPLVYEQIPLWLTDDELAAAWSRWTELLAPLRANQPGGDRRRTLLSLTLFPDASAAASNAELAPDVHK